MRQRTTNIEVKKYAVELMKNFGTFEYTLNYLEKLEADASKELHKLGENPHFHQILDSLKVSQDKLIKIN